MPPTDASAGAPPFVWLLIENRTGDNNQLQALADALGWPFDTKHIEYNQLRHVLYKGLAVVRRRSRALIRPPWPDLVICIGYTSIPVARYIRRQTGGRAKLVHIGNPRGPVDDFDLQIATPQYPRRAKPNLLELPFPIGNPARSVHPTADEIAWLAAFHRPRRLIAVGGPARHWELDEEALVTSVETVRAKAPNGSMIIATSDRTRPGTKALLEQLATGPNEVVVHDFPRFATLLRYCDEIHVTADSVSMIAEAVLTGKPVGVIPIRRSRIGKLAELLYERPSGQAAFPDFPNFWALLERERLVGTVEQPVQSHVTDTTERAANAVRALFEPAPGR